MFFCAKCFKDKLKTPLIGFALALTACTGPVHEEPGTLASTLFPDQSCAQTGSWIGEAGKPLNPETLLASTVRNDVVLLCETHDNPEHHRWQLHVLAALFGQHSSMAIGLEMLPRSTQAVLDAWVAGELSEEEFLEQSGWRQRWGFDPSMYLPVLHFARMNRIKLLAMNVERSLVSKVGRFGFDEISVDDRNGLTVLEPASEDYRDWLFNVFSSKHGSINSDQPATPAVGVNENFDRFVEAQLTWDRGMAEVLHDHHVDHPEKLLIGLAGSGHVRFGWGIAHQLRSLGIDHVSSLIPVNIEESCNIEAGYADAVFTVSGGRFAQSPSSIRLGIRFQPTDRGLEIQEIVEGSVAERHGLLKGDVIISAAGRTTNSASELLAVIDGLSSGLILPVEIIRDENPREILLRLPVNTDDG